MGAGMDSVTDGSSPGLLLDANVLIDYEGAAPDILGLTAKHLGSTAVATGVFAEVHPLEPEDLAGLGIHILHPTPDQVRRARRLPSGTSFNDRLSFIVCRDGGRVCVTNDLGLRKLCGRHGVPTKYGLELIGRSRGGRGPGTIPGGGSRPDDPGREPRLLSGPHPGPVRSHAGRAAPRRQIRERLMIPSSRNGGRPEKENCPGKGGIGFRPVTPSRANPRDLRSRSAHDRFS